MAVTPVSAAGTEGLGLGAGTLFHAVPFQCSIRGCANPVVYAVPTAQASEAETTDTPWRRLSLADPPGFLLGTRFHEVPFQCRISVWDALWLFVTQPTAQAFWAEVAATPCSTLLSWLGSG